LQHLEGLNRRDWQPILVYHPDPGISAFIEDATRLEVRLVEMPSLPLGLSGGRRMRAFCTMLHTERPSIFHAHLSWPLACKWGLVAALLSRVPAVIATLQLWVDAPYTRSARWQQRMIAAHLGRYIAVSHDIAGKLEHVFNVSGSKLQVIHNSVDDRYYKNAINLNPPADLPIVRDCPVVLTVARLDKQKGLPTLLEAATQVPEAFFVLVGEGPERRALEARCHELGLEGRVYFAGFRQDIPAWLGHCNLFVLPSLYEGVPLSLLEAMAAGKPVIASAIPGNDEAVIHAETGWLVPPGDAAALAKAIRLLLSDPKLADRLALAGHARAQKEFASESMMQQIEQVYTEVLEKAQGGGLQHA
jgi:glycosyltransferase involved in cell wall biosynthesis